MADKRDAAWLYAEIPCERSLLVNELPALRCMSRINKYLNRSPWHKLTQHYSCRLGSPRMTGSGALVLRPVRHTLAAVLDTSDVTETLTSQLWRTSGMLGHYTHIQELFLPKHSRYSEYTRRFRKRAWKERNQFLHKYIMYMSLHLRPLPPQHNNLLRVEVLFP